MVIAMCLVNMLLTPVGFIATLQPDAHFGRILAAYGGVFVPDLFCRAWRSMGSGPTGGTLSARSSASSASASCTPTGLIRTLSVVAAVAGSGTGEWWAAAVALPGSVIPPKDQSIEVQWNERGSSAPQDARICPQLRLS